MRLASSSIAAILQAATSIRGLFIMRLLAIPVLLLLAAGNAHAQPKPAPPFPAVPDKDGWGRPPPASFVPTSSVLFSPSFGLAAPAGPAAGEGTPPPHPGGPRERPVAPPRALAHSALPAPAAGGRAAILTT